MTKENVETKGQKKQIYIQYKSKEYYKATGKTE